MAVRETLTLDISQALAQAEIVGAALKTNIDSAGKSLGPNLTAANSGFQQLETSATAAGAAVGKVAQHGELTDQSLKKIGSTALVTGGLIVGGLALAVNAVIGFDKEMSNVAAVSGAGAEAMGRLREAAIAAGQATVFSASEAAQAEAELARAGVSTADILGGALTGALNLAAAGQLDLATAATITATALNIFNLSGEDATRVADTLAAGANKSAADVTSLAEGMEQAGPAAATLGISLEETVATLALLADNGIKGSEAGNTLKRALIELAAPTDQQAQLMKDLNLHFFDSNGRFIGLAAAADQLKTNMAGLDDQTRLADLSILGSAFGMQTLIQLYNEGGKGVREYTNAVTDTGAAQRFADEQLNNLAGDLEQLQGSIETVLIQSASGATSVLRGLAQGVTESVNAFGQMDPAIAGVGFGFSALAGFALLAVGAFGTLKPKFDEVTEALSKGGATSQFFANNMGILVRAGLAIPTFFAAFGPLKDLTDNFTTAGAAAGALAGTLISPGLGTVIGATLGGIAGAVGLLGEEIDTTDQEVKQLMQSLDELEGVEARRDFFKTIGTSAIQLAEDLKTVSTPVDELARKLGSRELADTFLESANKNVKHFADVFNELAEKAPVNAGKVLEALKGMLPEDVFNALAANLLRGIETFQKHAGTAKESADAEGALKGAMEATTGAAGEETSAVDSLNQALDSLILKTLDSRESGIAFDNALRGLGQSIDANSRSLDVHDAAGAKNVSTFDDLIKRAIDHGQKIADETGNLQAASGAIGEHINAIVNEARNYGFADDAIKNYLASLINIPPEAVTNLSVEDTASLVIERIKQSLSELSGTTATPGVEVHSEPAKIDIATVNEALSILGGTTFVPTIDPNTGPSEEDTAAVSGTLNALAQSIFAPTIDPNQTPAEVDEAAVRANLDALARSIFAPTIDANEQPGIDSGEALNNFLSSLGPYGTTITATAETGQAEADLNYAARVRTAMIQGQFGGFQAEGGIWPGHIHKAQGGMMIPARPGGVQLIAGEAGSPEVILPTDNDVRAISLLRAAGLGRLLGSEHGGGDVNVASVQIIVNASGDSRRDIAAGREAGTAAYRSFMQKVRSSGRR